MNKIMTVFGIRPDFIRASVLLKKLDAHPNVDLQFVYTGQHYDENLKGIFFKELGIPKPKYNLDTKAGSHPQQHAKLIEQLEKTINSAKPDVVVFLGDANAVIGCIAPLKMGIPIAHIEAGMRSYDWRMPEEKNRVIVDRVSDVLYCYQEDYKYRLIQEGVCPTRIVVTGNTIVDVLNENFNKIVLSSSSVISKYGLTPGRYAVQTLHRSENMNLNAVTSILNEVARWSEDNKMRVVIPVMPRLKNILKNVNINMDNFILTEPLGFFEFVALEINAGIEFTDSGTNQETSAILGTPCVVTRISTERPETFDSGITEMANFEASGDIYNSADKVFGKKLKDGFSLGDGNAADIIIDDLLARLKVGFNYNRPYIDDFKARNWRAWK